MTDGARTLLDNFEALPDRERSEVLTELMRRSSVWRGAAKVPGVRRDWGVGLGVLVLIVVILWLTGNLRVGPLIVQ